MIFYLHTAGWFSSCPNCRCTKHIIFRARAYSDDVAFRIIKQNY